MVVTDMDGTLLDSSHRVSDRFFELVDLLSQRGVQFVAASGRQYHSMTDKLGHLADRMVIVAENGAYVRYREVDFALTPLKEGRVSQILESIIGIEGINPVLCTRDSAFVSAGNPDFVTMLSEYYQDFQQVEDLQGVAEQVLKVAMHHFEDSEKHIYPRVSHFEGDLKVKVSGKHWVDVSDPKANKGAAIELLMEEFSIKPEELMVFGDYNNDLEMLALTPYSYAMENAHARVKAMARYQTLSNDERGVEAILEKLI